MLIFALLIIMNLMETGFVNPGDWIMGKLILLPGILIGLSFHEFAHGAVSYALGDPTPKLQGRLTLNPAAHFDPFGFLALLFAGFGWGIPVEIDPRYYKHRRRDELLVSLAGVVMNLVIALVFSFVLKALFAAAPHWLYGTLGSTLIDILFDIIMVNVVLMIFNLIPVPPLDGFGIVTELFNLRKYDWYYQVYDKGFLILLVLVMLGVTDKILTPAVQVVLNLLLQIIY